MPLRRFLVVLAAIGAFIPAVPAVGLTVAGALGDDVAVVRWSGQFAVGATGPVAPDPAACSTSRACDTIAVDVAVPSRGWAESAGGLLVAVQWPVMDAGYDLDLYVYRAGERDPLASSTSTAFSRYEAAWVPDPTPGRYLWWWRQRASSANLSWRTWPPRCRTRVRPAWSAASPSSAWRPTPGPPSPAASLLSATTGPTPRRCCPTWCPRRQPHSTSSRAGAPTSTSTATAGSALDRAAIPRKPSA